MDVIKNEIKLLFAGDICIKENVEVQKELIDYFNSADFRSCNLEGPILQTKFSQIKKAGPCIHQSNAIFEFMDIFKFDLYNLGNNHVFDYGDEAIDETIQLLGIEKVSGISSKESKLNCNSTIELGGCTIGIVNVAEDSFIRASNKYYIQAIDVENVLERIKLVKENYDFCIVQAHAGAEGLNVPLPDIEKIYKKYIEQGADIIVGHHPHVIQAYEKYLKGHIFYSIGNFCFSINNGDPQRLDHGIIVEMNIKNKELTAKPRFIKFDGSRLEYDNAEIFNEAVKVHNDLKKRDELIYQYTNQYLHEQYPRYLLNELGIDINSKKSVIRFAMNALLKKESINIDYNWIFHNHYIQTNRWIIKYAVNHRKEKS